MIDLSKTFSMYRLVLANFLGAFVFGYRVVRSPCGQVPEAILANGSRAISLGDDVDSYGFAGFVLSAGAARLAGGASSPGSPGHR